MDIVIEKNNAIRLISAEFISLCENLIYEAESLQINLDTDLPKAYLLELTQKRDLMENLGTRMEIYLGDIPLSANILLFKTGMVKIINPSLNGVKKEVDIEFWKEQIKIFKTELFEYFEDEFDLVVNEGE